VGCAGSAPQGAASYRALWRIKGFGVTSLAWNDARDVIGLLPSLKEEGTAGHLFAGRHQWVAKNCHRPVPAI
jgi:hypothetical protein